MGRGNTLVGGGNGWLVVACAAKGKPPQHAYEPVQSSDVLTLNIEVEQYEVSGESAAALDASMAERGPKTDDGTAFDGYATWYLKANWSFDKQSADGSSGEESSESGSGSGCGPSSVLVTVDLYYIVPQAATSQRQHPGRSGRL